MAISDLLQLKSLDISNNSSLIYFDFLGFLCSSSFPRLESFNISGCTALRDPDYDVYAYLDSDLDESEEEYVEQYSLNLTKCPSLKSVNAANTKTGNINPSACTKLKQLFLSNTQVSKLDLSKNPTLQGLDLAQTPIIVLDLLKSTNLEWLNVSACTALKSLKVAACENLEQLNASKCKNLSEICISRCNKIKKINLAHTRIAEMMLPYSCDNLEALNLTGCKNLLWLYLNTQADFNKIIGLKKMLSQTIPLTDNSLKGISTYVRQRMKAKGDLRKRIKRAELIQIFVSDASNTAYRKLTLPELTRPCAKKCQELHFSNVLEVKIKTHYPIDLRFPYIIPYFLYGYPNHQQISTSITCLPNRIRSRYGSTCVVKRRHHPIASGAANHPYRALYGVAHWL